MELDIRSEAWRRIWHNIGVDYGFMTGRVEAEWVLAMLKIVIIKDADDRWSAVKLDMSEEDLTLFLMRWS
jgi:hypothetical protein